MDDESGEKMEEVPLKGLGDYTRIWFFCVCPVAIITGDRKICLVTVCHKPVFYQNWWVDSSCYLA